MPILPEITASQLLQSALAVPAFAPVMLCPGYAAAWITNLHAFRSRSVVERLCWSLPLSIAVSGISAYLIARFASLDAAVGFFFLCTIVTILAFTIEARDRRRTHAPWPIGFRPLGPAALLLLAAWVAFVLFALVDIQHGQRLFMNVAMSDQSFRVHWTESILLTGVPPANPLYTYLHPAPMRNYYFFYIACASVAAAAHLPVRAVLAASCVWTGFSLFAIGGLFLKHLLGVSTYLRAQFLRFIALVFVSGLDILPALYNVFVQHTAPPSDLDLWSQDAVLGWLNTLLWAPHHAEALVCCMLAFLLVWTHKPQAGERPLAVVCFAALALASSFGISVYVTFAFFLIMLVWAASILCSKRALHPVSLLASGGAVSLLLLIPFLTELIHASAASGPGSVSPFRLTVRQMLPPESLLATPLFASLAAAHPILSLNLARLVLLVPGYILEFGFGLAVLLIYLVPAWRGRVQLLPAQRAVVFLAVATLPFITFIRSQVIRFNDFGFRGALIPQFCMLLLAAELLSNWKLAGRSAPGAPSQRILGNVPAWLRSIVGIMLLLGILTAGMQALWARSVMFLSEASLPNPNTPAAHSTAHNAYISAIGYARLDAVIPRSAVVQFNPAHSEPFWIAPDQIGVHRLVAISGDQPSCGAELGGDPSGCLVMAPAIDTLYNGQDARSARNVCARFGIQFLVVRAYDPAWSKPSSWVWTLPAVVADPEFRALDCRTLHEEARP
jgi:hypothetical protein